MKKLVLLGALSLSLIASPVSLAKPTDAAKTPEAAKTTQTNAPSQLKVGVINVREIMSKSDDIKRIEEQMKSEFQPKHDQVKAMETSLRENVDKLNRNKEVMNEKERSKLEQDINKSQQDLMKLQAQYSKESSEKQQQLMQAFFDKMNKVVSEYAKSNQYDMVLISDAVPYMTDKVDITDKIMENLKKAS